MNKFSVYSMAPAASTSNEVITSPDLLANPNKCNWHLCTQSFNKIYHLVGDKNGTLHLFQLCGSNTLKKVALKSKVHGKYGIYSINVLDEVNETNELSSSSTSQDYTFLTTGSDNFVKTLKISIQNDVVNIDVLQVYSLRVNFEAGFPTRPDKRKLIRYKAAIFSQQKKPRLSWTTSPYKALI